MNYIERKTIVLSFNELPFEETNNVVIKNWANILIIPPTYKVPIDIGACCYKFRKKIKSNSREKPVYQVVLQSLIIHRSKRIKMFLEELYLLYQLKELKHRSISEYIYNFRRFLDWCDTNGHSDCLKDISHARSALRDFIHEQQHFFQSNAQSIYSSNFKNGVAKRIVSMIFDENKFVISRGVPTIHLENRGNSTNPVPSKQIDLYRNYCLKIFRQLFDFIYNNKKYPFILTTPDEELWVFPAVIPFLSKTVRSREGKHERYMKIYNFDSGTICKPEELTNPYSNKTSALAARRNALKLIDKANYDMQNHNRVQLATLAFQCFISYLMTHIPINLSVLALVKWDKDKFDISNKKFALQARKARAGDKLITMEVPSHLNKDFRKFLKLRLYLLGVIDDKKNTEYLFFNVHVAKNNNIEARQIGQNFSFYLNNRFKRYFGDLVPHLTTRQFRASISDQIISELGPLEASDILQNDLETTLKHYAAGTKIKSGNELTNYFNNFNEVILNSHKSSLTSTSVGSCNDYGNPDSNINSNIEPDCAQFEGCLFCDKFKTVIDDEHIRKLLSLKFVILETKHLSKDMNHFELVFNETLERIELFISQIKERSPLNKSLTESIEIDVNEEENLSVFWEHKLQQLIDLGVA